MVHPRSMHLYQYTLHTTNSYKCTLHTSVPDPDLAPSPVTQLQVRIQVARGAEKCPWSKDFSLDTVGYAGAIQIEHGGTAYLSHT